MNKKKQQKRNKPGSLILLWLDTMAHLLIAISVLFGTKIADMSLIVNLTLSVSMIYYAFKPTVDWFRRLYGR